MVSSDQIFKVKRAKIQKIPLNLIERAKEEIDTPSWFDFERAISPIWARVLNLTGHSIKDVFEADNLKLVDLYEKFFLNGLSDGAAIGSEMYKPRSYFKILFREKKRYQRLKNLEKISGVNFRFDQHDFGRPWNMRINGKFINFELTDHYYFALIVLNLVKSFKIPHIIFLGD